MHIDSMPLDHTFFENIQHGQANFPIQFYVDELHKFMNRRVPLHWHFEPEFFVARGGAVQVQVGHHRVTLNENDGIFISSNTLHCFEQMNDQEVCECPNIVFSGELIAHHSSILYQKYLMPFLSNQSLPYVVLDSKIGWHHDILKMLDHIFALLQKFGSVSSYGVFPTLNFNIESLVGTCFEFEVQCLLNKIFQSFIHHWNELPQILQDHRELQYQVRLQNMISFIQKNYMKPVTLQQISNAASISKSEASRCFHSYMNCSPVDYLLQYRIETAQRLLHVTNKSIQDICLECGFNSTSYFIKMFKNKIGMTPGQYRKMEKTG